MDTKLVLLQTTETGGLGMVMEEIAIKMILIHLLQLEVMKLIMVLKLGLKGGKDLQVVEKDVVLL